MNLRLDGDACNANLRTLYDRRLSVPENSLRTVHDTMVGNHAVIFTLEPGVTIGSISTDAPALRTGKWPAGTRLRLQVRGRVQG